jgi:hypothetical protein
MASALNGKERQADYHEIFTGIATNGNVIPGADESTGAVFMDSNDGAIDLQSHDIAKAFRRVQNFILLRRRTGSTPAVSS